MSFSGRFCCSDADILTVDFKTESNDFRGMKKKYLILFFGP